MEQKVITFREGLPGFEDLKEFILLEEEGNSFYYLQSVKQEEICFVVINPYEYTDAYQPNIQESYFAKLGGGETEEFVLYTILTLGKNLEETVVNLQAPVLVHVERREGVQVIIEDKKYSRRTGLTTLMNGRGE